MREEGKVERTDERLTVLSSVKRSDIISGPPRP